MAKCIRCDGEMWSFVLSAWGHCNHCGFAAKDMAEILGEMLPVFKYILEDYETIAKFVGSEDDEYIQRAHTILAKIETLKGAAPSVQTERRQY